MAENEITLRYGFNPHQVPARLYREKGGLPFRVLNGSPGYINMLDALNSWQLVKELKTALGLPAAASFKHVSPAGAAVGIPLDDALTKAYFVEGMEMTPLSAAYARARGADRVSSYGDWVALSDTVDMPTARIISREVSDGVIAPGYEKGVVEILSKKKGGRYPIIEMDADYTPEDLEVRDIYGVRLEQKRNDLLIDANLFKNVVTEKKELPESAIRDLIVCTTAIKYTQSNTIGFAVGGQAIGLGAGQQSRIHCTRLAADKADKWLLRQHPTVLELKWKKGVGRPEKNNAIDLFLQERLSSEEQKVLQEALEVVPSQFSYKERRDWLDKMKGVVLSSDAFIPFRDTIDRASQSGVSYVVQAGGSLRDDAVIEACNGYGMVMVCTKTRLFHH
ncbi:phosphoribosylaminoimidazolecarboxamide formyltransferase [Chloroflexota bacterium]